MEESRAAQNASTAIAPEIKVLWPQIKDIAINHSVFASVNNDVPDTVHVAIVSFTKPLDKAQTEKFKEYLEARLKLSDIQIVNANNLNLNFSK